MKHFILNLFEQAFLSFKSDFLQREELDLNFEFQIFTLKIVLDNM